MSERWGVGDDLNLNDVNIERLCYLNTAMLCYTCQIPV